MSAANSLAVFRLPRSMADLIDQSSYNRSKSFNHDMSSPRGTVWRDRELQNHSVIRNSAAEMRKEPSDSALRGIIPAAYGQLKGGTKKLQKDGDLSDRAARSLIAGDTIPSTRVWIKLMCRNPAVAKAFLREIGYSPEYVAETESRVDAVLSRLEAMERQLAELRR